MSENGDRAVRALHALADGDIGSLERLHSPDFVDHTPLPGQRQGLAGLRERALVLGAAFFDARVTVQVLLDHDDAVVCSWRVHAVHKGEFLGLRPTGRQVAVGGISLFRFSDGRVVEQWTELDHVTLLSQLRDLEAAG